MTARSNNLMVIELADLYDSRITEAIQKMTELKILRLTKEECRCLFRLVIVELFRLGKETLHTKEKHDAYKLLLSLKKQLK